MQSGAPWRDLPERFGPYTTGYNRFVRWRRAGVWDRILDALSGQAETNVQMIDRSIVRVHQHAACIWRDERHCAGRSRGGLTTKIHAVVDHRGLPLRLALSAGQDHDSTMSINLLRDLIRDRMLLADKAYHAESIRAFATASGGWANIPPRRNRREPICFSPYLYRARNQVERFFNRIKQCRRITTRYDKLAENFLALVKFAARVWLRVNESTP